MTIESTVTIALWTNVKIDCDDRLTPIGQAIDDFAIGYLRSDMGSDLEACKYQNLMRS